MTQNQRLAHRQTALLPILTYEKEILKRLKANKVVVVQADTGSGKSTQLPRICAEEFQGLVVCTQPHAIAAISVAHHVAYEYDCDTVGANVGYDVGNRRRVEGLRIMIMTDSALIRMAQNDPQLGNVEVLIIDEAHERTVNTDVVVGISKTILKQRPDEFKIVIASATMDPKPFLEFLFDNKNTIPEPLIVPGQIFPITIETRVVGRGMEHVSPILVEEVVRALKHHRIGNCLVFLPDGKTVENAIRKFKKMAHPKWIALPMYDSIPVKAQNRVLSFDDQNGDLRMVVFCTNVAETSLTIPNVGLVIDTGLVNELRYDADWRMNTLDEVYICKTSAIQRKNRAGSSGKGHYICLYSWDALTRSKIEPAILRSSLDHVMLKVFNLGFNHIEFDFVTRPNEDLMLSSLASLTRMGCLTTSLQLTERGWLYDKLPFDSRLSHFVMLMHDAFAAGRTAIEIATIMSASGSMFVSVKECGSKDFNSDVLLLHSAYSLWLYAGTLDGKDCCISCKKQVGNELARKDSGCRECRVKYAKLNNLNNEILENIRETAADAHKFQFLSGSPDNMDVAVSVCLARSYAEQICEFLVPSKPAAGMYIIESRMKGHLSISSVLRKLNRNCRFFIPMSIKKLPSGSLIVDQAHCIVEEYLPIEIREKILASSLDVVECFQQQNLHYRYADRIRKYFESKLSYWNQDAAFIVCDYDSPNTTVTVYGPRTQKQGILKECQEYVQSIYKEDLECTIVVECLHVPIKLVLSSGLHIDSLERMMASCKVNFHDPPVESDDEFLVFVCKITPCSPSDIRWHKYFPARIDAHRICLVPSFGTVKFHSPEKARLAEDICLSLSSKEDYRPGVIVASNINDMNEFLVAQNIIPAAILQLQMEYEIHATNIPAHLDETRLRYLMQYHRIPMSVYIWTCPPGNVNYSCSIGFASESVRDQALIALQGIPELNTTFPIPVLAKDGESKVEQVTTTFTVKAPFSDTKHYIIFQKVEEADKLYDLNNEIPNLKVDGHVKMKLEPKKGFSLDEHLNTIAIQNGVKHFCDNKSEMCEEITFYNGPPSKCVSAAESLKQMMTGIKYIFGSRDKQVMGEELLSSGKFKQWAKDYSLHLEELKSIGNVIGIAIYGDGYNQGQFMAQIADYCSQFLPRYHLMNLSKSACLHFDHMCPGETSLNDLAKIRSDECRITFQSGISAVEFVVQPKVTRPPAEVIKDCQAAVDDIMSKFQQMPAASKKCVYCHSQPGSSFIICGHPFCKECLEQAIDTQIASFPLTTVSTRKQAQKLESKIRKGFEGCPSCNTKISIKDLENSLSKMSMQNACFVLATLHLKSTDHPLGLCPVPFCGQVVDKEYGYSTCLACGMDGCPLCGVFDDLRHRNLSCTEYSKLVLANFGTIDEVVEEAKTFVKENWPLEVRCQFGQLTSVEVNPGLKNGCMALQRYCAGIKYLKLQTLKGSTIFAWHGTAEASIPSICNEGFNPARRRLQAWGPGEYFGCNASVSLGYSQGCNHLIVAQLVNCVRLSVKQNFCYVMNNPTNWRHAFCLPVLVIAFGSSLPPQIPWISNDKMPIPPPFFEPVAESTTDSVEPSSEEISLRSYFRWHWENELNDLRPYPDAINDVIEKAYLSGTSSIVTQPVTRNADGTSQVYQIDLVANTQTNLSTGYVRKILSLQDDRSSKTGAT